MNVTVVVGGRWHAFDLAAELHRAGVLHRIVTNYPRFAVRRWGIPSERVISLPSTLIVGRALSKVSPRAIQRHQYRLHRWFASAASRHLSGSDLLVGWSSFSEPSVRWARDRDLPFVLERGSAHIEVQDALLSDEYKSLELPWPGIDRNVIDMELREYELCTKVSIPSLFVERSFLSQGFPVERLFRNPYGVNLASFQAPVQPPRPPTPDYLEVIYAGGLSVRKGTHHLLNAYGRARRQSWRLTLVGGMTPESQLWISEGGKGIHAVGHQPQGELQGWYGRAHCFVMPSIEEGLAMVQVQALACGLPLICTTNTGGEDLLRLSGIDGRPCERGVTEFPAGFVVPIRDPDAIARCLDRLAGEEGLWAAKREAALSIAESSLSWKHYGDRAVSRYRKLFARQPGN
ncbi:MAG: glycosyltransferase family 4 protein [Gammaproteobacteria bacterium]|nr:glycosyltransferase family 4 protein [Gammaproteobacteria bacterium]